MVQRERHDRHRNLVVAATGTGRQSWPALDYKGLGPGRSPAEPAVRGASRPDPAAEPRHVPSRTQGRRASARSSAGVESLAGPPRLRDDPVAAKVERSSGSTRSHYDVVIVDEFHHAEAPSYAALLEHVEPQELLGLTATPERMDGGDVRRWFGGRIAVELRVWEAIDRGFLCPFQYFGVADTVDLSDLAWRRGGYDLQALDQLVTGDDVRARRAAQAVEQWHPLSGVDAGPGVLRVGGPCRVHGRTGSPATGSRRWRSVAQTPRPTKTSASAPDAPGEIRACSRSTLGEGVDVPNVDTVLLLRPTQSATVFSRRSAADSD